MLKGNYLLLRAGNSVLLERGPHFRMSLMCKKANSKLQKLSPLLEMVEKLIRVMSSLKVNL